MANICKDLQAELERSEDTTKDTALFAQEVTNIHTKYSKKQATLEREIDKENQG